RASSNNWSNVARASASRLVWFIGLLWPDVEGSASRRQARLPRGVRRPLAGRRAGPRRPRPRHLRPAGQRQVHARRPGRAVGERGIRAAVLSLDDCYLDHDERARLARDVHPLLATRGPPGTHDIALATQTLDALRAGDPVALPRFDKLADSKRPRPDWPCVEA